MCQKKNFTAPNFVISLIIIGSVRETLCAPETISTVATPGSARSRTVVSSVRVVDKIVYGPDPPPSVIEELGKVTADEFLIASAERRHPDEIYLIDGLTNEEVTMGQFLKRSYRLAAKLQELGCKSGTVVALCADNRLEYPIIALATLLTGATFTGFGPGRSVREYLELLEAYLRSSILDELEILHEIAKPDFIFCCTQYCDMMKEIAPLTTRIVIFDPKSDVDVPYERYSQFISTTKTFTKVDKDPEDVAILLYTGGTSGPIKGAMIMHKNLVFALNNLKEYQIENTGPMVMPVYSMGYVLGLNTVFPAIVRNEKVVIVPTTTPDANELLLSTVEKYKINRLFLLAGTVLFLLRSPTVERYDLSSLHFIYWGGGPLSFDVEEAVKNRLNLRYVQQVYGMTELATMVLLKHPSSTKPGTCGSPVPGMRLKIVSMETGETLGPTQWGEIQVNGPLVMKGYYKNEGPTAETIDSEGWLHTGDIGYYDEDGDFFIVDRAKELIKTDGHQVWPAELETFLRQHPSVADVAVIGIPNDVHIEVPRAYVVKRAGVEVTENELIQHIENMVNLDYKTLRGGVEFVSEIPKNAINKVLRRELRDRWKRRNSQHQSQ